MGGGRIRKSIINIICNATNQILTLILSLISRTVFIRFFGAEYLGLSGLLTDVLSLLSLADLGLNTAMVYSFYRPLAENNYHKMAALTDFYKKVYHRIAAAVMVIGIFIIPFLPSLLNTKEEIPHLILYYLLSLANVVVSYLCIYRTSILTADQNSYIITSIGMGGNIFRTILQVVIILVFKSYVAYLAISVAVSITHNLLASYIAVRRYPFIREKERLDFQEQKDIYKNIKSVFIYKLSSTMLNATDNILISLLINTAAVGIYSNYMMIQNRIGGLASLVFTSLTASIGNLIVKEKAQKRYRVFKCEQTISFLISMVIVPCYGVLVDDFIFVWLGIEYKLPVSAVYATTLNLYLSCILQPLWSYREATGLYRKTKWIMLICALMNLFLSIFGGILLGIAGILLATSISRLLTYVWYEPRVLFKECFEESERKYFIQIIWNMFLVILLIAGLSVVERNFNVNSWISWIEKAIFSAGICIIVSGIVYFRNLTRKVPIFDRLR